MLYGYRETVDNRVATLVVAADTVEQFDDFIATASGQLTAGEPNFVEIYTSRALQHLVEDLYKGYKKPVHVFYHSDEAQRDAFVKEWDIREVKTLAGRDRQEDMIFEQKKRLMNADKAARDLLEAQAEERGEEYNDGRPRTIGEIHGLTEGNDRWDRRSEAEKEQDKEMRERIKKAQKEGKMSGDSFTGGKYADDPNAKKPNGDLHITDIVGGQNADGTFDIENIRAVKIGGPVDEELKQQREEEYEKKVEEKKGGKRVFSPEDFAAVLRGDGSADHLNVKGDMEIRRGTKPIERPSLSQAAEDARKEYQEEEQRKLKERAKQLKKETDMRAKAERDQNIFRGADLGGEDDVPVAELTNEELRSKLTELGVDLEAIETLPVKDYPYNSELAGRLLLPTDGILTPNAHRCVAGVNLEVEGTISMGEPQVLVVKKKDENQDAWAVYQKPGKEEGSTITSLVHIR